MHGYTASLVLEGPMLWWPSLSDLQLYPLHPDRTFLAAVSNTAMPWPPLHGAGSTTESTEGIVTTVELSQLGRSIFLTAEWSTVGAAGAKEGATPFVKVYDPFRGGDIRLPVCTKLSAAVLQASTLPSLMDLARENRIRISRTSLDCHSSSSSGSSKRKADPPALHDREDYLLLQRHVYFFTLTCQRYLQQRASYHSMAFSLQAAKGDHQRREMAPSYASILFSGETRLNRHLLRLLEMAAPPMMRIGDCVYMLEMRCLNFVEVLSLDPAEVLETLEVLFRHPPMAKTASCSAVAHDTVTGRFCSPLPCMVIVLEHLDLLSDRANPLVVEVMHHLCHCIDQLDEALRRERGAGAVLCSFGGEAMELSTSLAARLGKARVLNIGAIAEEERLSFWQTRLRRYPSFQLTELQLHRLTECSASFDVHRLLSLSDQEVQRLLHEASTPSKPESAEGYQHLYGLTDALATVESLVVWPLGHLPLLRHFGISCSKGLLLCGPSGSGKTSILSALARRLHHGRTQKVHVMSVDGLSLIEKEVGRSEKNIAQLFETARAMAPTALFIDNLNSLAPPRGQATAETNIVADRTLSTLLTQMDGVNGNAGQVVVVIACSPSLDVLDAAVYRPGRLDVHVQLQHPSLEESAAAMAERLVKFIGRMRRRRNGPRSTEAEDISEVELAVPRQRIEARAMQYLISSGSVSPADAMAAVRDIILMISEEMTVDGVAVEDQITEAFRALERRL